MFLSNLHLINKVLLKYLNVASFLWLGVFNSIFRVNSYPPLILRAIGEDLLTKEAFTYLGNTVRHDGGASMDIKNCLVEAINAVKMFNYVWRS